MRAIVVMLQLLQSLTIIILPFTNAFIDVRHRYTLPRIPNELKQQIVMECEPTFKKFFQARRRLVRINASDDHQQCPIEVNNCFHVKTSPFMEHCDVKCMVVAGKALNDLECWNDNCFVRATRICEEKFWRTISTEARKKKKKKFRCSTEIKHCYKLACMKCLGRECDLNCYGAGVQFARLSKPRWKGYEEFKKFFPEVEDITHKYVIFSRK